MRGVSADALRVATERTEALAESGDAERLGADLFAVHGVLVGAPALRRVITDPSAPSSAKARLAESIFSGKVADSALEVVTTIAGERWSGSVDFVAATEQLGALAYVIAAEKQGQLDGLEDDLFRFGRVVAADHRLRDAITNRRVPAQPRQELVANLLEGRASTPAVQLAVQAVATSQRSFEAALEHYQEIAADRQARVLALVRSALELTEEERSRLAAALKRQYGRDVHLNVIVDPQVLGGIEVDIGDEVIDGTVAGRLDDARRRMTG